MNRDDDDRDGSPSTIRNERLAAQRGTPEPQRQDGDRRSARIEAQPDITLAELQALVAMHDVEVAIGMIWQFFKRCGITRKKDGARDRAGSSRHLEAARGVVRRAA